jgi:ATP-binding protein involved in chromosome partitioning
MHLSELWGKEPTPGGNSLLYPEMPSMRNAYGTGVTMGRHEHGSVTPKGRRKAIKEMSETNTCSPETSCGNCDTASTCDSHSQQQHMQERLAERLSSIKHRLVVMSGKGGVGKSTVAANLAVALAANGHRVGILDGDVHGPNIPKMLGLDGAVPQGGPNGLRPLDAAANLSVMSMAFLLPDPDTPVAWRGPMKHTLFQQFLTDVDWGELDYLVVDLPPGTGDEPMSIAQILGHPLWAIIVTTPQEVALLDSRKSVVFAKSLDINVLGIVENMSGLTCPHCQGKIDLFKTGGGEKAATDLAVPFLGAIPIDPMVVLAGDAGIAMINFDAESETSRVFRELAVKIDGVAQSASAPQAFAAAQDLGRAHTPPESRSELSRTIAVPSMHPGGLDAMRSGHFGHCDAFTLVRLDNGAISDISVVANPPHQQGGCQAPVNLLQQSRADALIVGGIGMRPLMGFHQAGIDVYYGPEGETVGAVIAQLLEGKLELIQENQVCGGGQF